MRGSSTKRMRWKWTKTRAREKKRQIKTRTRTRKRKKKKKKEVADEYLDKKECEEEKMILTIAVLYNCCTIFDTGLRCKREDYIL